MNWRKGFFRLWLVASVLWVALVGAVVGDKVIKHPESNISTTVTLGTGTYELQFPEATDRAVWQKAYTGFVQLHGNEYDQFSAIAGSSFEDVARRLELAKAALEEQRSDYLLRLVQVGAIAFGVPAVVLLLGAALSWALRGFRQA